MYVCALNFNLFLFLLRRLCNRQIKYLPVNVYSVIRIFGGFREAMMRPSIIERFLKRIPLPYPVASLALAIGVILLGLSLSRLADTGNLQSAFYYLGLGWKSQINFLIGNLILPIYALISIKYMKNEAASGKAGLIELTHEGEKSLSKAFKGTESSIPIVVIIVLLLIPTVINQDYLQAIVGPVTAIAYVVSFGIISLIYATFLWTYISLVKGLYQLGKFPLKLTPFYQDNTLGLKPLGNLSLKLSLVYFVGVFLILLELFINPLVSVSTLVEIGLLILLGVLLFFLPLYTAHKRLVQEREHYLKSLRQKLDNTSFGIKDDNVTFENLNHEQATKIIAHDILEQRITAISSWPIDPTMVRILTALTISTVTTLVGRLLLLLINL